MHKSLVAVAAASVLPLFVAQAVAAPADQDACNALAFSLAEKAAGKKLGEAEAVKVDEMIGTLETQCADGKLEDAGATASKIEAALK